MHQDAMKKLAVIQHCVSTLCITKIQYVFDSVRSVCFVPIIMPTQLITFILASHRWFCTFKVDFLLFLGLLCLFTFFPLVFAGLYFTWKVLRRTSAAQFLNFATA